MPVFGGSLLFLYQSIRYCKGSSKKSDKQGLENMPTSQLFVGKLVRQLKLDTLGPPFLGHLLLLTLILAFSPCLMHLLSKFLQNCSQAFTNQTIHKLLLTRSNYQKLLPYTNSFDPHSSFFLSHPHDAPSWRKQVLKIDLRPLS